MCSNRTAPGPSNMPELAPGDVISEFWIVGGSERVDSELLRLFCFFVMCESDIRKDLMVMLHYSSSAVMQSGVRVRCCCCWRSTVLLWVLCSSAYYGCVGCVGTLYEICVHVWVFGGWPLVEFITEGPDLNPTVRYCVYRSVKNNK